MNRLIPKLAGLLVAMSLSLAACDTPPPAEVTPAKDASAAKVKTPPTIVATPPTKRVPLAKHRMGTKSKNPPRPEPLEPAAQPIDYCSAAGRQVQWMPLRKADNVMLALEHWVSSLDCRDRGIRMGGNPRAQKALFSAMSKSVAIECFGDGSSPSCVALRKKKSGHEVLPIATCQAFNLLATEAKRKEPLDDKSALRLADVYLNNAFFLGRMNKGPSLDSIPGKNTGEQIADWFKKHPKQTFDPPQVSRQGKNLRVRYFRVAYERGMFVRGEILFSEEAQILKHEETDLLSVHRPSRSEPSFCGRAWESAWPSNAGKALSSKTPVTPLRVDTFPCEGELKWQPLPKGNPKQAIKAWVENWAEKRNKRTKLKENRHQVDYKLPFDELNWVDLKAKHASRRYLVVRISYKSWAHAKEWLLVQPSKRRVARIRSCGELNSMLRLMKTKSLRDAEMVVDMAEAFLGFWPRERDRGMGGLGVIWGSKDRKTGKLKGPAWFDGHLGDSFYPPQAVRKKGGWVFQYYRLGKGEDGIFRYQVRFGKHGQVVSRVLEKLTTLGGRCRTRR